MANLIDEIVSQKAFDQVQKLKTELADTLKAIEDFYKRTGSMPTLGNGKSTSELEKMVASTKRLTDQIQLMGQAEAVANQQAKESLAIAKDKNKELANEDGSINQLRAKLNALTKEYERMGAASREAFGGKTLHAQIMATRTEVDKLEQSLGNYRRNVGNYTNATFQLSQVFRELPAFTFSAQTGVMALSNNLPMLADAFRTVRQETGSTMKALAVFGRSVLSVGNIFTLAMSAFLIFNKEIMSLFENTEKAADAFDVWGESMETANAEMGKLRLSLELVGKGVVSQEEFLERYNETLGKVAGETDNFNEAEKRVIEQSDAYIQMMVMKAKAAHLLEVAIKKTTEANQMQDDWWTTLKAQTSQGMKAFGSTGNPLLFFTQDPTDAYNAYKMEFEQEREAAEEAWRKQMEELEKFMQAHGFVDGIGDNKKGKGRHRQVNRIEEIKKQYDDERALAETNYNLGKISFVEYQMELQKIAEKYQRIRLDSVTNLTKEEVRSKIDALRDISKDEMEISNNFQTWLTDSQEAGSNAIDEIIKKSKENARKSVNESLVKQGRSVSEMLKKILPKSITIHWDLDTPSFQEQLYMIEQYINSTLTAITTLNDALEEREKQKYDTREKRLNDYYDQEERRINQTMRRGEEKEEALMKVSAQREAAQKKIDRERAAAERKAAARQKAIDVIGVIANTALAITRALTDTTVPNYYVRAANAVAAGVVGSAQVAALLATPLPEFAKGTENSPEGYAVVGEKGHELVIEPSGKKWVTPAKDTITYLKKGSKVIPNEKLMKMVQDSAYVELANMNMPVTPDLYGKAMIDQFEKLSEEVSSLKAVMANKDMRVHVIGNFDHYTHIRKNIR